MTVEVSVLGPLRARRDGEDRPLGGRRQQAVLARLALVGGRTVATDRLVDELWDGSPPPTAVATLQSYVSNLRRLLGTDPVAIERDGDGYRLRTDVATLTAERFEALVATTSPTDPAELRLVAHEEALGLWHGAVLGELAEEPWAQGDAVRLTELRLAAEEGRCQALLDLGRAALAVGDLDALARAHPLRERFTALLVLALYRAGRQAEALRAYERQRTHLAEELGLDPSPELARLAAQVLEQDPALDLVPPSASQPAAPRPTATQPSAAQPAAPMPGASAASTAGPVVDATVEDGLGVALADLVVPLPPAVEERRARSGFVGREGELAAVDAAWGRVVDGESRLVLLAGEPGAGKTRVAQQAARRIHERGGNVWWGRCTAEDLIAFQPIVEALRTGSRALPPDVAAALARERPPIAVLIPDVARVDAPVERSARWELFEAMVDLLEEGTSSRPLLLVVDDVHWADPATLLLLDHVLRRGRASRLMVVATVRRPPGRPTPELDQLVADLRRDGRLEEVAVGGMGPEEVVSLLDARGVAVTAAQAEALRARTGGNPFFLEALVEHGAADVAAPGLRDVPPTVRDLLDDRLRALGDDALQVLSAAAVVGPRVDLAVLGAVVDLDTEALLDVVDAAVAARLLVEDEELGWVGFPHALVRAALVARTTRNREALLHLRVADAVEARADHLDREAVVATHLLAAGRLAPAARVAEAAIAAGRRALTGLADEDARRWARRALEALEGATADADGPARRAEVRALVLLSETERMLGDPDPVRPAYLRAVEAADGVDLDLGTLAALGSEAAVMSVGHDYPWGLSPTDPEVVALLQHTLDRLPDEARAVRALFLGHAAMALAAGPDQERAVAWATQAVDALEVVADPSERCMVILNWRQVRGVPDALDERVRLVLEAASADRLADFGLHIASQGFASTQLLEAGRFAEAAEHRERHARRVGERLGPFYLAYVHFLDGLHAFLEGRVDEAEAHYDEGIRVGEPNQTGPGSQWQLGRGYMLARARGREQDLAGLADRVLGVRPELVAGAALRARALVADGRHAETAEVVAGLDRGLVARAGDDLLGYLVVDLLAEVAWSLGDAGLGRLVADVAAPWAGRVGVVGQGAIVTGPLDRTIGLALAAAGDLTEAEAALGRAAAMAEEQGWAPTAGRVRVERAHVSVLAGGAGAEDERAAAEAAAAAAGVPLLGAPGWS